MKRTFLSPANRRARLAALTLGCLLLLVVGLSTPAVAATAASSRADTREWVNPVSYCRDRYETRETTGNRVLTAYWVPMRYVAADGTPVVVDFPIQSLAGCITTVAPGFVDGAVPQQQFSFLAALSQCRYLEETFGITYPYVFYGQYEARNRVECARILLNFVRTQPPPGGGPPV